MVFLQANRTIEFHAQGGLHYKTRIPRFGRDMAYSYSSCDLLIVGASSAVYRLNLDQGRFFSPLETQATAINVSDRDMIHRRGFEWICEDLGMTCKKLMSIYSRFAKSIEFMVFGHSVQKMARWNYGIREILGKPVFSMWI